MNWQVAVFALLVVVVVAGFGWYERTRPPARLIALVAALAALAVAGRLVLAPIPNVVATTDIALLTGYALGGPPGFAVGALAAPISNIWLGQGPWTAWQMAGWGLVGLAGRLARSLQWPPPRAPRARRLLCARGPRLRCPARPLGDGHLRRRAVAGPLPGPVGKGGTVQHCPRGRQLRDRAARRPGAGEDDRPLPHPSRVHLASRRGAAPGLAGAARRRLGPRSGRVGCRGRRRAAGEARDQCSLAGADAELRRRLRRDSGVPLQPGDDRLGDARPRGGRAQSTRRAQSRQIAGRLPARASRPARLDRRPRAHDPRPRGSGTRFARLRRHRPGRRASRSGGATARSAARST